MYWSFHPKSLIFRVMSNTRHRLLASASSMILWNAGGNLSQLRAKVPSLSCSFPYIPQAYPMRSPSRRLVGSIFIPLMRIPERGRSLRSGWGMVASRRFFHVQLRGVVFGTLCLAYRLTAVEQFSLFKSYNFRMVYNRINWIHRSGCVRSSGVL